MWNVITVFMKCLECICNPSLFNFSCKAIYRGFGGGDKGLPFRELLSGLVLIVCGTKEEKAKCKSL